MELLLGCKAEGEVNLQLVYNKITFYTILFLGLGTCSPVSLLFENFLSKHSLGFHIQHLLTQKRKGNGKEKRKERLMRHKARPLDKYQSIRPSPITSLQI